MRKERGSLVIFLALVMPFLILFAGALMDLVRIKQARSEVSEALYTSLDSVLADYNRGLREEYGIFAFGGKCYRCDVHDTLWANLFRSKKVGYGNLRLEYTGPLNDSGVLRGQMLEEMKVRGLVNFGKDFLRLVQAFKDVKDFGGSLGEYGGTREEVVAGLQDKVAENMVTIKDLEARRSGGESGLDGMIDDLYQKNKDLLVTAENLANSEGSAEGGVPELDGTTWSRLGEIFGSELSAVRDDFENPAFLFYEASSLEAEAGDWLEAGFLEVRDKYLLAEYVLEHFDTYADGGGQVEVVAGRGSGATALLEVLLLRTFLDGVGYYAFDASAPPEPLERLLYSAVMGLATGVVDTLGFVSGQDDRVPVVNMFDNMGNPLERVELSYRDHLELLLLTVGEEELLASVYGEISGDFPGSYYTGLRGGLEVGIELTFLGGLPDGFELMGGRVEDGVFIFEEVVEVSYR